MILVFGELFALGWPVLFGVRTRRGIVAGGLAALLVIHWQVEGLRWQMIPIYVAALGFVIGDLIVVDRGLDWGRRIARGLFGLAAIGIASAIPILLPVPELPPLSGPSAVGTFTVEVVDSERQEIYGPAPGGPRRLNVQVWYPSEVVEESAASGWATDWEVVAPALARHLGFPGWFLNHTRYTEANSSEGAPLADGTFPVVIYSHGWSGFRNVAVNQMESLASNGYIVIAPDHTYGAVATRFEDGDVAELDPEALPEEEEVGDLAYDEATAVLVETFASDLISILDALDEGSAGPFRRISEGADLTRIGIYGHSTGGGAAVRACLEDEEERCDAVLGMDAWVEPLPDRVLQIELSKPSMFMRSDEWRGTDNDAVLRGIAGRTQSVSYWLGIDGAHHNDFVIAPLLSPIGHRLGIKGPIPAGRVLPIIDRYLVGFFDVFLLETGSAAIDTASFEEVSLEVILPDT